MATYSDPTIIQFGDKRQVNVAAWLVLVAGVVSLLGAALFYVQKVRAVSATDTITAQIAQEQIQLNSLQSTADELTLRDHQAKDLQLLFNNQKNWNAVLGTLEQRFYKNMAISSLQLDDKGNMNFAASAPTYTDYAKIYSSLTDVSGSKYFATVVPSAVTKVDDKAKNTSQVNFSFALTLQKNILNTQAILFLTDLVNASPAQ